MEIFLETDRLILRRLTLDDIDNLVDLDSDPAVMRYLTGGPPTPREEIQNEYMPAILGYYQQYDGFGFWAVIEKSSGDFIGWFHFRPEREDSWENQQEVELGYRLKQLAWGKGYATEGSLALIDQGFEKHGVMRVVASTYEENAGSRRVMEKVGMRLVRTFRYSPQELEDLFGATDPSVFDGEDVEYAITRPEWEAQRAKRTPLAPPSSAYR